MSSERPTETSIDAVPLDVFGAGDAKGVSPPPACQWCEAVLSADARTCPACGATAPDPDARFPGLTEPYPGDVRPEFGRPSTPHANLTPVGALGDAVIGILKLILRS